MKMLANVQLSPHKYKTPEGYLICQDCIIGRTGKQTYLRNEIYPGDENGMEYVDIDRSEKEVFDQKTIASFENKPLTIEHPDNSVNPSNYKTLAVGNVHNVHKGDYNGEPVMYADIVVFDAEAINKIETGEMVELSCGYDCDITDGPNPEQINIRGNHVALCEQGRAGIARIQDSWGAKPINDSVGKGTLIQEFGKQGKQYKITKIVGNVIYAESLETEKIVLFKKDEENVEWATITKSEVKDSNPDEDEELGYHVNGKLVKNGREAWDLAKKLYKEGKLTSFTEWWVDEFGYFHANDLRGTLKNVLQDADPEHSELYKEIKSKRAQQIKEYYEQRKVRIKHYMESKAIMDYNNDEFPKDMNRWVNRLIMYDIPNFEINGQLTDEEKELVREYAKYIYEEFIPGFEKAELVEDAEPEEKHTIYNILLTTNKPWDYTLNEVEEFIFDNYYHGGSLSEIERIAESKNKDDYFLIPIAKEYSNIGETEIEILEIGPFESQEHAQRFIDTKLKPFVERYRTKHNGEEVTYEINPKTYSYDTNEIIKDAIKHCSYKDKKPEEETSYFTRYQDFYNELFDYFEENYKFVEMDDDLRANGYYKIIIYDLMKELDWEKTKAYIKELINKYNLSLIKFGTEEGWYITNQRVSRTYTVFIEDLDDDDRTLYLDSNDKFVIALSASPEESTWLDDWDRPTPDFKKAKRFNTYEEADSHRKTYCKGAVQRVQDSKIKDSKLEKEDIEEVKKKVEGIDYKEPIEYDNELKTIDISFSDKRELRKAGKKLVSSYDLELNEDPEELSITLYEKFDEPKGTTLTEDSYSRKFYVKAIKALEDKLKKLERNEILDENNDDYESQKTKMISSIKSQIEEYKAKLENE